MGTPYQRPCSSDTDTYPGFKKGFKPMVSAANSKFLCTMKKAGITTKGHPCLEGKNGIAAGIFGTLILLLW
jgi:hypothetical protein